ncbi:putative mucin TcMUCII [Trypanosoma cruzi]|uniref:Putative mucin TcMUCII n=1 Tax=Trypanosoma cruzi TaxID=5693 RepID=A0A2V2UN12_TRYCR|nr:putative mucin TcMUCII [Trypanosoma cruzi]
MMMTCRLLCALLVLALCCCPSVCVSEESLASSQTTTTTTTTKPPTTTTTTTTKPLQLRRPQQRHQLRPPPLQHRHQALRLQRHQLCRPPTHRHVFAKSTAASAALRGCLSRWCSPHPCWRTPLWAEEVCAGCACQHSTAGICARVLLPDVLNKRNNDCVLLHLLLLPCCVLRVAPRIRHFERIADTLTSMRTGALGLFFFFNFCFLIIVFYCFLNLWFVGRCASSAIVLIPSVSWCVLLLRCCRLLLCVV